MADSRTGVGVALVLTTIGRFLYKLCLAIAIVWMIGLLVGAIAGDRSGGGGATEIQLHP